jgi:serine/threonine-protein kinase
LDFETLWSQLKLDARPDAGVSVEKTWRPDWAADTVISGERLVPAAEAALVAPDIHLSLSPPASHQGHAVSANHADLVILGELGKGGMGSVLLARQPALDRDVAVKVPHRGASAATVQALVREARTTGSLEHPGIVPVHALAFDPGGVPAMVMKRIEGVSWGTLLEEPGHGAWRFISGGGRDRLEAHVQLLMQVCNAVAFAHRQGVLHRDIKPANVMIGEFGEVYLVDWGVATKKPLPGEQRPLGLVGTPVYFAPEMVTGDDAQMDERTDVYLLGATLYHALAGWPPHPGTELKAVLEHAWSGTPPPLPPEVPDELAQVVFRALAHDKAQRFQSAAELRDALAQFLRHRGSHRLASATAERLALLETELALPAPSRERVSPLVSECRFGFMQALSDWPENPAAREGLERTVLAAAWFEVKAGNADAARALVKELRRAPDELMAALRALELEDEKNAMRKSHFAKLERELDPRVAMRQRARLFFAIGAVVLLLTVVLPLIPAWSILEGRLGRWSLVGRVVPSVITLIIAGIIGRRSLFGTRLNRRVFGLVALSIGAVTLNRLACAALGLSAQQTYPLDLLAVTGVAMAAGLLVHWGFFVSGFAALMGAVVGIAWPGAARVAIGGAAALGFVGVVVTWRTWRSEISAPIDWNVPPD